jgi:hypothetical protein
MQRFVWLYLGSFVRVSCSLFIRLLTFTHINQFLKQLQTTKLFLMTLSPRHLSGVLKLSVLFTPWLLTRR